MIFAVRACRPSVAWGGTAGLLRRGQRMFGGGENVLCPGGGVGALIVHEHFVLEMSEGALAVSVEVSCGGEFDGVGQEDFGEVDGVDCCREWQMVSGGLAVGDVNPVVVCVNVLELRCADVPCCCS